MGYEYVIGKRGRIIIAKMGQGEELVQSLLDLCEELDISVAIINSFIGTVKEVYLRNPRDTTILPVTDESKFSLQGDTTVLMRKMEIVSIQGNIVRIGKKLFSNLHGVFSESGGNVRGGHIFDATIWSQAEVVLQEIEEELVIREMEKTTGLMQWRLKNPSKSQK